MDDVTILDHFDGKRAFKDGRATWSLEKTALFCRIVKVVHLAGLDWWHSGTGVQVRFGRKSLENIRAARVFGIVRGKLTQRISILQTMEALPARAEPANPHREPVTQELVEKLEQYFEENSAALHAWPAPSGRIGYWPDELQEELDDLDDLDDEMEDHAAELDKFLHRVAFNRIYYGPPGTGKTHRLQRLIDRDYTQKTDQPSDRQNRDLQRYEFITFHQSFGYEEFVEGLRPVLDNETSEVKYEIRRGAFLRLCDRARKDPRHQYAMLIDEINRGNVSKIFGELITLIEIDKREGAPHAVSVTLPFSGQAFSVPSNIDVIGTMNTADRSLALVDTALRRRFEFMECMPQAKLLDGIIVSEHGVAIDIARLLEMLNRRIEALHDRDHTIGHAYFTHLKDLPFYERFEALKLLFKNKIIPLLEEYFFEDWQKIRLVLGDNQKSVKLHQFIQEIDQKQDLVELFGDKHQLDHYAMPSRYRFNLDALDQPESYFEIYEHADGL